MGLLSSDSGEKDLSAAEFAATGIQGWWNGKQSPVYGFKLALYRKSLQNCCDIGARLFGSNYFANPPGPFKRAAAFIVIGRLFPFFQFVPMVNGPPMDKRERHAWLSRMMALAIPSVLERTRSEIGGKWIALNKWNGFPSLHYKLEFLAWFRWLDGFEQYKAQFAAHDWDAFCQKRLARMVMATSLMIESCYYNTASTIPHDLCGNTSACFNHLEEEHELDLIYDVFTPKTKPEFPPGE